MPTSLASRSLRPLATAFAASTRVALVPTAAHARPPRRHTTLGGPPVVAAPVPGNPVTLLHVPEDGIYALMTDGAIRSLADGRSVMKVGDDDPDYSVSNVLCAAAEGPRFACLYVGAKTQRQGQSSCTQRKPALIDSAGKRETIASAGGDKYSVAGLRIHLHGDQPPLCAYSETLASGNATKTTQCLVREGIHHRARAGLQHRLASALRHSQRRHDVADVPAERRGRQARVESTRRSGQARG